MRERCYLLTGATGNLGFAVLRRLLRTPGCQVVALVRPGSEAFLSWCLREEGVDDQQVADRLSCVVGDLREPWCGLDPDDERLDGITDAIHCAAEVRWDADPDRLFDVNVRGTRRLLDLLEERHRNQKIERITVVSSAYVSPDVRPTVFESSPPRPAGFNNPYEATKFLMEREALARDLPISIVRPSVIGGDSETGRIQRFTTFYFQYRLIFDDRFAICPGYEEARVDIVPVDYVTDLILALHERGGGPGEIFHACAGSDAVTLGELYRFGRQALDRLAPRVRARRAVKFVPPRLHVVPARIGPSLPGQVWKSIRRLYLYVPYMTRQGIFSTTRALALWPGAPHYSSYVDGLCQYAIECRFRSARRRFETQLSGWGGVR